MISISANKENSMENILTDVKVLEVNFETALQKKLKPTAIYENLALSTELIMWIGHCKELLKVTLRVLALCQFLSKGASAQKVNFRNYLSWQIYWYIIKSSNETKLSCDTHHPPLPGAALHLPPLFKRNICLLYVYDRNSLWLSSLSTSGCNSRSLFLFSCLGFLFAKQTLSCRPPNDFTISIALCASSASANVT